jgi:hypothetical protein
MIYFARRVTGGPIKIGIVSRSADQSEDRAELLDAGYEVLVLMDGGEDEERALLRRFSRFKIGGAWLRPGPALLEFIAGERARYEGAEQPGAVPA